MALSAVLFDLDGTLLDTNDLHTRAWVDAFDAFGYRIPPDRVAVEIGKGGDRLVPSVLGRAAERACGEALRQAHGERYRDLLRHEPVPIFPGTEALFEALRARGLRTAVATASKAQDLEAVLARAGLDLHALADAVVTDSDVDESKPAPDVVQAALDKLGCSPAESLFVGDTPYDVTAGMRAGVVTYGLLTGVHPPEHLRRRGARAVYDDVAALEADLDGALEAASPFPLRLTAERLDALMEEALAEARAAMEDEDQLPVGAILVRGDGTVVGRGRSVSRRTGIVTDHAEMRAIAEAGPAAGDAPLLLITTLEPCVMCFGAAQQARVDTIVYALAAPPNGAGGRCRAMDMPGMVPPRLVGGVGRAASRALLVRWRDRHPEDTFAQALLEVV